MFPGKDLTSVTHLHFRDDDVLSALVSVYSFYSGQGDGGIIQLGTSAQSQKFCLFFVIQQ